ncbi:MAG: DMT family transporter [Rhodospirillaceae bacterium]
MPTSPGPLGRWFYGLPGNTRGFIWIILSSFAFVAMIVFVRLMSDDYNTGELAFWRALLGFLCLLPVFMRSGRSVFRIDRLDLHLTRNLLHFVGVAGWYFAVAQINLSVGMSLQFSVPLFTIVMAIIFLGERVDTGRWIATGIGFAGVLIILRPGLEPVSLAAIACIVSSLGYAGANIATKLLMRRSSSDTIVLYMNAMHIPMSIALAMAMGGIHMPPMADLPGLIGIGVFATLAHWLLAKALGDADASMVIIVDFTKLPWVTLCAFLFFREAPVLWAWIGGAVIFASTYYIVRRETRAGRRRRAAEDKTGNTADGSA